MMLFLGKNIGNKGVTLTLIGKMVIMSQLWRVLLIFIFFSMKRLSWQIDYKKRGRHNGSKEEYLNL